MTSITYNPIDLGNCQAHYTVTNDDGSEVCFKSTAFMVWNGLAKVLDINYPNWIRCEYVVLNLSESGTIYRKGVCK